MLVMQMLKLMNDGCVLNLASWCIYITFHTAPKHHHQENWISNQDAVHSASCTETGHEACLPVEHVICKGCNVVGCLSVGRALADY